MVKKAELEKYLLELSGLVEKQVDEIKKLKKRVNTLESEFKTIVKKTKIHCVQPYCDSLNVEFIGYENLVGFDTNNKKYRCRDCGYEWIERK